MRRTKVPIVATRARRSLAHSRAVRQAGGADSLRACRPSLRAHLHSRSARSWTLVSEILRSTGSLKHRVHPGQRSVQPAMEEASTPSRCVATLGSIPPFFSVLLFFFRQRVRAHTGFFVASRADAVSNRLRAAAASRRGASHEWTSSRMAQAERQARNAVCIGPCGIPRLLLAATAAQAALGVEQRFVHCTRSRRTGPVQWSAAMSCFVVLLRVSSSAPGVWVTAIAPVDRNRRSFSRFHSRQPHLSLRAASPCGWISSGMPHGTRRDSSRGS